MSTTVVHPRTTRFPGQRVGMIILGVALAAALGYGISVTGDEQTATDVAGSGAAGADQLILNKAAELTAERQHLLNQATKGIGSVTPAVPRESVDSLANWLAQSATSHVSAGEFADQLTRSAASKIGTDAWGSYLSGSWVETIEATPTFDGQPGPR